VDDYLDSFLTLVSNTGYTDPRTLVVKFCRGLKSNIQSQIATIPFGQPTDTDLKAWYAATQRINQARLTNEAFQSMLWSTTMALTHSALPQSTPLSVRLANSKAGIKPTALLSAFDKENSIEFLLDLVHYIYMQSNPNPVFLSCASL